MLSITGRRAGGPLRGIYPAWGKAYIAGPTILYMRHTQVCEIEVAVVGATITIGHWEVRTLPSGALHARGPRGESIVIPWIEVVSLLRGRATVPYPWSPGEEPPVYLGALPKYVQEGLKKALPAIVGGDGHA